MKLNFFFDIDGTILPVGKSIPASAVEAIGRLKRMGHGIFLCTGRSPYELTDEIRELGFDGGVFSSGATLVHGGSTIMQKCMTDAQRDLLLKVVKDLNLVSFSQSFDATYITREALDLYDEMEFSVHGRTLKFNGFIIVDRIPDDLPIIKSYIMSREGRVLEARRALEGPLTSVNNTTGLPETSAAEIMIPGVTKASGIRDLMDFLGEGIESTVGIGDGENDLEMIDVCNLGIAMGNACEVLKRHSDYVTTDIEADGLANAIDYALGCSAG
ncbi:MAG: HAD-IIB family hydrolase [Spirochaetales bacterium]|nr:HAD-IIB family hydrolase [Spirochaetales bacterium]